MSKSITSLILLLIVSGAVSPVFAVEGVLLGMPDPTIIESDDGQFYIFATGRGFPSIAPIWSIGR